VKFKKAQYGIYGIIMTVVALLVWAAINPIIEQTVANGTAALTPGTMEYILSPFLPILVPITIIFAIVVYSRIGK
jgi:hypothetical protein